MGKECRRRQQGSGGTACRVLVVGALTWPAVVVAAQAPPPSATVDWFAMGMGLFGGLALFLFGIDQMSRGLKAAAGESLKMLLGRLTGNRLTGALTGALVTAVLNSSSVTTVLVVGFVTAGLLSLSQSISVIMGANIGSTVTAQLIAFNVTQYALLPVAVGFALLFAGTMNRTRHYGEMVMGLGLVFFGMGVMSDSMVPLRGYDPFLELMRRMENPLLGILVGTLFTGLVQSSAATTGLAIVMATEGLISLPAGIALAFGANIGTCATALLAAMGKPRDALRAAVAHVTFNIVGVLVWIWFIDELAAVVTYFSPSHEELAGTARMAAEVPRQIANAHTAFNVLNTLIFLGFSGPFARLILWLVPPRPEPEGAVARPKFLAKELVTAPALALERVRLELGHLGELVLDMLGHVPEVFTSRNPESFDALVRLDDSVDALEGHIVRYLGKVRQQSLTEHESRTFLTVMNATTYIESIGDVIESDMVALGRRMVDEGLTTSEALGRRYEDLFEVVYRAFALSIRAVRDNDAVAAKSAIALKRDVNRCIKDILADQAGTLADEDARRLARFRAEMEGIDNLKRMYTLSKRIAKSALDEATLVAPDLDGPQGRDNDVETAA